MYLPKIVANLEPRRHDTRSRLLHAAASPLGSVTPAGAPLHLSARKNCSGNRVKLAKSIEGFLAISESLGRIRQNTPDGPAEDNIIERIAGVII